MPPTTNSFQLQVDVNRDDMVSESGVQAQAAADLPEPERNHAVYYPRKLLFDGSPSEERATRFQVGERTPISSERTTLSREYTTMAEELRSQASCTPPPEYLLRPISPEQEECDDEESTISQESGESFDDDLECFTHLSQTVQKHWLFAEEIQEVLRERCVPFHIQGVPASSPHVRLEGLTAKTVLAGKRVVDPQPNEVVVSVVRGGKRFQISINPSYLVPWAPAKGNRVLVVECRGIGKVGKLTELKDGSCTVKLESSKDVSYFGMQEVVNIL